MLRNFISLIAGIVVHYLLIIATSRLSWLLIVGNRTGIAYKDGVIRWMLWRTFAIDPVVAVVVAVLVAWVVRRPYWWLGGVAVLPLLIYGDIRAADRIEIAVSVVYVALALAAAFTVSRFKRPLAA